MSWRLCLMHACTVMFFVTSAMVAYTGNGPVLDGRSDETDGQRNERSTPRSFILPATPAVTEEQEEGSRERAEGLDVFGCLAKLRALGYGADNGPPLLRSMNLEAVFRFQKDHGLATTARLNGETVRMLKCGK